VRFGGEQPYQGYFGQLGPERAVAFLVEVRAEAHMHDTARRVHVIECRGQEQAIELGFLLGRLEFGADVDMSVIVVKPVELQKGYDDK
jgi:hypothetical protein